MMSAKPTKKLHSTAGFDPETGLVKAARKVPSPNYDDRPEGAVIEALIIHAISLPPGQYGGACVEQFFCNQLDREEHPFEDAQYQTLFELTHTLILAIPTLSAEHIYGHADIAPGRKTDPGPGFDWSAYRLALSSRGYQVASKHTGDL
jgi:N-acetyl-anhydromuramyl-L-alanine amidase AmpD